MEKQIESIENYLSPCINKICEELHFFSKKEYKTNLLILTSVETKVDVVSFISNDEYNEYKCFKTISKPLKEVYFEFNYNINENKDRYLVFDKFRKKQKFKAAKL